MSDLHICVPTSNGAGILKSAITLMLTGMILDRNPVFSISMCSNRAPSRNECINKAYSTIPDNIHDERMLWLDSDITIVNDAASLAEIIKYADERNINIVGNYIRADDQNVLMHTSTNQCFSDKEIAALPDYWQGAFHAGLGFYYGVTPRGYKFHEDSTTDDVYFFFENEIKVTLCKALILDHTQVSVHKHRIHTQACEYMHDQI